MLRAVDLDQLTNMLAAMPGLLDALAFSAGHPDPGLPHPAAQRLPRNFEIMTLCQLLGRECRSKVCVALPSRLSSAFRKQAAITALRVCPSRAITPSGTGT